MRFSLSSWKKKRLPQGLVALTLGAATVTFSGCKTANSTGPVYTTAHEVMPVNGTPNGNIQQVHAPVEEIAKIPPGVPMGQPADLTTYWDKEIQMAVDPARHGEKTPCLVGRLILLDGFNHPICCEGTMTVTLYDDQPPQGGPPVLLEKWDINANNLRKMIRKDSLHMWGYTLAMPTATCTPATQRIHLNVEITPQGGQTLFTSSGSFKLKSIAMGGVRNDNFVATAPLNNQPGSYNNGQPQMPMQAQPQPYMNPGASAQPMPQYQNGPPVQMITPAPNLGGQMPQYQNGPPVQMIMPAPNQGSQMPAPPLPQPYQGGQQPQQLVPPGNMSVPPQPQLPLPPPIPYQGGQPQPVMPPQFQGGQAPQPMMPPPAPNQFDPRLNQAIQPVNEGAPVQMPPSLPQLQFQSGGK